MDSTILASIAAVSAAISGLLTIWNFFQSPSKKNASDIASVRTDLGAEIKAVDDKTDAVAGRVSTLETVLHQMPDKDSLHRLEISLERMTGEINTLNAKLLPVENLSRRLQEFMLERAK